jgi:hypothetical protein
MRFKAEKSAAQAVIDPVQLIESEVDAGASLTLVVKHPLLRHLNRSLVCRWLLAGKIPAIRLAGRWYSTDAQIRLFIQQSQPSARTAPSVEERHQRATARIEALRKRGAR